MDTYLLRPYAIDGCRSFDSLLLLLLSFCAFSSRKSNTAWVRYGEGGEAAANEQEPEPETAAPVAVTDQLSQLAESQAIQRGYEAQLQDMQRQLSDMQAKMQEREHELRTREQHAAEKEAEHERLFHLAERLGKCCRRQMCHRTSSTDRKSSVHLSTAQRGRIRMLMLSPDQRQLHSLCHLSPCPHLSCAAIVFACL